MTNTEQNIYKEINTAPVEGSQVVEIEDDINPAVATEETTAQPDVKPDRRPSRAEKRIKELVAKTHEAEYMLQKERAEKMELQKQLLSGHTTTKESLKAQLEAQVTTLHTMLADAMQSGDSAKVVALQDQMINAKLELKGLQVDLQSNYKAVEDAKVQSEQVIRQQPQSSIPEKALEWIEDHPEFKTDELFHNSSLVINNQLLREGFDAQSDEFYEELSQRLSKRFPEVFGVIEEKSVSLSNNTDSSRPPSDVKAGVPVQISTQKARSTEQVVSGSSRPSANVIPQRNKTQVTLTPADVKQAEAWGLDLKQMARRIAHKEANTRTDGYVSITIPKN